eukprot:397092_1
MNQLLFLISSFLVVTKCARACGRAERGVRRSIPVRAAISDFDFGEQRELERFIETAKEVAFVDKSTVTSYVLGLTQKGEYGEEIEESFSFGFTETIGMETEIKCGFRFLAEGKIKISAEFSANQQTTTSTRKNFKKQYEFTPQETGIYEVGMIVYVVKNHKMPFTAKAIITSTSSVITGEVLKSMMEELNQN